MEYLDYIVNIFTFLLGGGLMTLVNIRSNHKKANEEAKQVEGTNMQTILETNQKYIVEPLTREIDGLRKKVEDLTAAIEHVSDCAHAHDCPVRAELQERRDGDGDGD